MTEVVFRPDPGASSQLAAFRRFCEHATGEAIADDHAFSVADIRRFWDLFLRWSAVRAEGRAEPVCAGDAVETARFFPGLRLSYAENVLAPFDAARPAVTSLSEEGRTVRLTRGELKDRVLRLASALAALGVRSGDRVVAVARNQDGPIVAALAAATLGATWSAAAPDMGVEATLHRFGPLGPVVLFGHTRTQYHGASRSLQDHLAAVARGLPTLRAFVAMDDGDVALDVPVHKLDELAKAAPPLESFPRFPFDHPLFILFSSGTTGPPKCIVHGHGGTLLEHLKEHRLHGDLGEGDVLWFQTGTGWMMWNWQLTALAAGASIVVYDGSVSFPERDTLLRLVAAEGATVFGTSPAYLQLCKDSGVDPREVGDFPRLRAILSTGSILFPAEFDWVRDHFKSLPLQSISGGTDIIGCFVLGSPDRPVWRGESPAVSLGLDVRALDAGVPQKVGAGELVCVQPFPSRPVGLFADEGGRRFHDAYFAQHEGVWTHGDFLELTDRGTARILGRSDGVLNIRGIRIGPAEIYHILKDVPEVAAAMAVDQEAPREPGGRRLVLLVTLQTGVTLDRPLTLRIKKELKTRGSQAHVPAVVAQVLDLPTTHSGKRSERAASDALNGRPVRNRSALRNPESLDALLADPALRVP